MLSVVSPVYRYRKIDLRGLIIIEKVYGHSLVTAIFLRADNVPSFRNDSYRKWLAGQGFELRLGWRWWPSDRSVLGGSVDADRLQGLRRRRRRRAELAEL